MHDEAWKILDSYCFVFHAQIAFLFEMKKKKNIYHLIFYVVFHDLDLSKVRAEKVAKDKDAKKWYSPNSSLLWGAIKYIIFCFSIVMVSYWAAPYNVNCSLKIMILLTFLSWNILRSSELLK